MSKDSPYSDWRVIAFKHLSTVLGWLVPAWFAKGCFRFFLSISPNIPVDLRRGLGHTPLKRTIAICFGLALFFCLVVTVFLCWWEGTLYGTTSSVRYFVQDGWNILFYALVCPTYVALACALIALTIEEWGALAEYADQKSGVDQRPRHTYRLYAVFFGVFLLCTIFITNYMHDILNLPSDDAHPTRVYWFMTALVDGTRTLNRVGYYYVALNFSLLFITLLGVAAFLSLSAEVIRAGHAKTVEQIDSFDVLQAKLHAFTTGYLLMKGLTAAYAVNYFVWAASPLGKTSNLVVAQIALTVVGVFFIAVPRQYIELKWYELWQNSGRPFEYAESRSAMVKATASFLDVAFIATIIGSWKLDENISKWMEHW